MSRRLSRQTISVARFTDPDHFMDPENHESPSANSTMCGPSTGRMMRSRSAQSDATGRRRGSLATITMPPSMESRSAAGARPHQVGRRGKRKERAMFGTIGHATITSGDQAQFEALMEDWKRE